MAKRMGLRPNLPNKPLLLQPEMDGQTDTTASSSQTLQQASPHLLGTAVNAPPPALSPVPHPVSLQALLRAFGFLCCIPFQLPPPLRI